MHRSTHAVPGSRRSRGPLRLALLSAALAACTPSADDPSADTPTPATAEPVPYRPASLPPEFASAAEFCAVPSDTAAAAVPTGSRAVAIGAKDRLDIRYVPFPVAVRCTLRTRSQWEQLWKAIDTRETLPSVPEGGMVVLAAAGPIPAMGHDIAIDGVWIHGDTATVSVRQRPLARGCIASPIITYPTAAVRIPEVPVVRFKETLLVGDECL